MAHLDAACEAGRPAVEERRNQEPTPATEWVLDHVSLLPPEPLRRRRGQPTTDYELKSLGDGLTARQDRSCCRKA